MALLESPTRRGLRLSHPNSDRFFTVMFVFSQRTFRWSLARKTLLWVAGVLLGSWILAMIGSTYGLWATQKIMSFSRLQRETQTQQRQLRESLAQAEGLDTAVHDLRQQVDDLKKLIDPKAPEPYLPLASTRKPPPIPNPPPASPVPESIPKPPMPKPPMPRPPTPSPEPPTVQPPVPKPNA